MAKIFLEISTHVQLQIFPALEVKMKSENEGLKNGSVYKVFQTGWSF